MELLATFLFFALRGFLILLAAAGVLTLSWIFSKEN